MELLPPPGVLLYAFGLTAREPGDEIRLEVAGLEIADLITYLQHLAPERAANLKAVAPLFADVERLHLSFDLGNDVRPRIGLEGSFPRRPAREPRWREFLDRLVQQGLATPERAAAALAWPGHESDLVRGVSHVKVVAEEGRAQEAKIYLTLVPFSSAASSPANRSVRST